MHTMSKWLKESIEEKEKMLDTFYAEYGEEDRDWPKKPTKKPLPICKWCHEPITDKNHNAKYCGACESIVRIENKKNFFKNAKRKNHTEVVI